MYLECRSAGMHGVILWQLIVKNLAHQVVCFSLLVKQWAAVTAMLGVSKVPEKNLNCKALNLVIYLD